MKHKDGTEFGYDIKHRATVDEVYEMFRSSVSCNGDWAQNESMKFTDALQSGDEIWWYSGPWGVLSGAEGYCIVRKGVVVHYVHTKMS